MESHRPPVCNYDGSDYQTRFWEQGGREYEDRVEGIALRRLLPESGGLLLELGAGAGRNTLRYPGFQRIVLLDYSRTQLQQAQDKLGVRERYIYVAADIYHLPFVPGCFDAATLIRTLHHLAEAACALVEVRQALRPGAVLVLEYANKHNLKAILRYGLRRQSWSPFTPEPVEFAELNFDFHPRTVRLWLEEGGFTVGRQLTVSHFRLGFLKRFLPLGLLVGLDSLFQWTGNWWQLTPSVFVKATAQGETPQAPVGSLFRCPECKHYPLEEKPDHLICPVCGRRYPIQDGIFDFRI
jgi:SAM-dependent methyltransferase